MTWYKLEDDQVDGIINMLYLVIAGCAAISFYLQNPGWQYTMLAIILIAVIYHNFLYNKHKHKAIEMKIRVISEKKIRELELELAELKRE